MGLVVMLFLVSAATAFADAPVKSFDETGRKLPPGVPKFVNPDGTLRSINMHFTTPAYQKEALRLVIAEANQVAGELKLEDELPITQSNMATFHIPPFGFAYAYKMIGFVETTNYAYYVSGNNKFTGVDDTHQNEDCQNYADTYTWPISRMDTNAAFQLATQWLAAILVDVKGLNRDCQLNIVPDNVYVRPPRGKFVPVYWVNWIDTNVTDRSVSVFLSLPDKKLLQLRIDDSKYNLRKPVEFTNLPDLFPGVAPIRTNYLTKPITLTNSWLT
jgi:hypothetical protein